MLKTPTRLAAGAGAVLLGATGLTLGFNDSANAATCYGGAVKFEKAQGAKYVPTSGWYKTSSRCADINIWIEPQPHLKGRSVKVCFEKTGCQKAYKTALVGKWTEIATDVKDGAAFRFQFETQSPVVGKWAA